jgi:hypothetical protein
LILKGTVAVEGMNRHQKTKGSIQNRETIIHESKESLKCRFGGVSTSLPAV